MILERKHANLIVTDFSPNELKELIATCSVRYREKNSEGRYYTTNIDHYQVVDGTFITSMAFLHGIQEKFPEAVTNIPEREKLPLIFKKNFRLWEEQQFLLEQWLDNKKRGTIAAVTGSGKTMIGLATIFYLRMPTLIVVPKKEIQRKVWKKSLIQKLGIPPHYIGLFDGENKEIKPFTIAIYNSGYLHIEKLLNKFELLIMDEAHHAPSKCFSKIALNIDTLYNIAVSATPKRQDRNDELIYKTMGKLIQGPKFQKLVDDKRIAPFEHERIFVNLLPEERKIYNYYLAKQQYAPRKKYNKDTKTKAWYLTELQKIALGSLAKIPAVTQLVFQHQEEKILIFTRFVAQAKMLKRVLSPFNAQLLLGETEKEERNAIFDWFHRARKAVLISSSVCLEGSEPIILKQDKLKQIKILPIAKFVDKYVPNDIGFSDVSGYSILGYKNFPKGYFTRWNKIISVSKVKSDILLDLKFRTGRRISVTPEHKIFILEDGKFIEKRAGDLKKGDLAIIAKDRKIPQFKEINGDFAYIELMEKSIRRGNFTVYDITTAEGNYLAGAGWFLVHNCDEGIDIPDAKIAIIMSGFGTKRQMIQRIGRTVRFQKGKIAKIYEVISRNTMDESQSEKRQLN